MDHVSHGLRRLPERGRYLPADAISSSLAAIWPRMRVIERNFAIMLGTSVNDPAAKELARRSVRNFGRMAIDFLTVRTMSDQEVLRWGIGVGESEFAKATNAGRGVIFALPHAGSWDVAAAYAQARGLNLTVVTESNWFTELVASSRKEQGVALVPRDRSLRALFRALRRKEVVVMLSDLATEGIQTLDVPFCGHPAPFPMGPARLAQYTSAPIMVVTSARQLDGTYLIAASAPLQPDPTRPAEEEVARLTAEVAAGFERIIRAYPDQWYPFHDVWPGVQTH
jgi:KDO2-lipid IV(A) lauroyltransferase